MKTSLDCIPCLLRPSLDAARLVTADASIHERLLREALHWAEGMDLTASPPARAQCLHRRLRKITGLVDPYRDRMRRLHPLRLSRERSPLFLLTWTVMHSIDQDSPLYGRTPQELTTSQADIVVSFSGIDEILDRPIHAHHNYPLSQVLFGHGFVDMMQEEDGEGQRFDFANFNRTYSCPSVEPS